MLKTLFLIISLTLGVTPGDKQVQLDVFLQEFNYWQLSLDLLVNDELAEHLIVTPAQLDAISVLRDSAEFRALFEKELRSTKPEEIIGERGQIAAKIFSKFDAKVHGKLGEILNESQLRSLRPYAMSLKFPTGASPFRDVEVLKKCGISPDDAARLEQIIEKSEREYKTQLANLHEATAAKIVRELDSKSKTQFAQYAGNKYIPGTEIEPANNTESIPFPATIVTSFVRGFVSSERELATYFSISIQQLEQIAEVEKRVDEIHFGKLDKKNPTNEGRAKNAVEYANNEIKRILSPEQYCSIARTVALRRFEANPLATFSNDKFLSFLGILGEDARKLRKFISDESKKMSSSVAELNRRTFFSICESLPDNSRELIQNLFLGVWDL